MSVCRSGCMSGCLSVSTSATNFTYRYSDGRIHTHVGYDHLCTNSNGELDPIDIGSLVCVSNSTNGYQVLLFGASLFPSLPQSPLYLSACLFLCLSVCFSVSLYPFLSVSQCICLSLFVCLSLSLSLSVSVSVCLCLSLCLPLSVSSYLCLSLSVSLTIQFTLSPSLSNSHSSPQSINHFVNQSITIPLNLVTKYTSR